MKFRKKQIEVEAHRWWKNGDHPEDGPPDKEGKVVRYYRNPEVSQDASCQQCDCVFKYHGWIDTLEGGHIVCPGDWVITGVEKEKYPCKDQIFRKTYDPVDDEATKALEK